MGIAEDRRQLAFTTGHDPEVYPSYVVVITRVADGETRRIQQDAPWRDDGTAFYWFEGNGACDCNRALAFAEAGDEPRGDPACGSSGYRIDRFEFPDGTSAEGDE